MQFRKSAKLLPLAAALDWAGITVADAAAAVTPSNDAFRKNPAEFFLFQAEDGIRDASVTGVQTCALPIYVKHGDDEDRQQGRRQHAAEDRGAQRPARARTRARGQHERQNAEDECEGR